MYLNLLINKLKSIWNSPFAEEMIKPHIDELTPFLFEFKVLVASFKRMVRLHKLENSGEKNITRLYSRVSYFTYSTNSFVSSSNLIICSLSYSTKLSKKERHMEK